jgi:hypothetical protein
MLVKDLLGGNNHGEQVCDALVRNAAMLAAMYGWVADCPLHYTSPNAPAKRDVLGTVMLCSPWLLVMVTVVRPAWLVCRPMAWSSNGRLVMASR